MEYSAVSIFTGNAELALNFFFFPPPEVIGRSPYFNTAALWSDLEDLPFQWCIKQKNIPAHMGARVIAKQKTGTTFESESR